MILAVFVMALLPGPGDATTYPINGTVVSSATGAPLARVRLTLHASRSTRVVSTAMTGDDGRFEMVAPAGKYSLSAERNGFATQAYGQKRLYAQYSSAVVVGEGLTGEGLVFRMVPSGVITGVVTDELGEGVPGIAVFGCRVTGSGDQRRAATYGRASTDEQGRYRMHSLTSGNYVVAVSGRPWQSQEVVGRDLERSGYAVTFHPSATEAEGAATVSVEAGKEARADVEVRTVPVVDVTARIEGAEAESDLQGWLTVPVFNLDMGIRGLTPVRGGSIYLTETPPGHYQLMLIKGGQRVWMRQRVTVEAGRQELTVRSGTPVRLRVSAEVRGRRAGGEVIVRLRGLDGSYGDSRMLDSKGAAEFPAMPAGKYQVSLSGDRREVPVTAMSAQGAGARGSILDVPAAGDVHLELIADLTLPDVEGKVYDGEQALAGVLVMLVPKRTPEDELAYRFDQSDSDGSFVWMGVPPGEYLMYAFADGDADDFRSVAAMRKWLERGQPVLVRAGMERVRVNLTKQ